MLWLWPMNSQPSWTASHDLGIVVAHLAVEGDGPAHAVPCEHFHDPKDADAVAIVARCPVDDVGRLARPARHRLIQRKGLDVGDDPEGDARAVWPGDPWPAIDRNVGERSVALRLHKHLLPWKLVGPWQGWLRPTRRLPRLVLAKKRSIGSPNRSSAHDVAHGLLGRGQTTEVCLVSERQLWAFKIRPPFPRPSPWNSTAMSWLRWTVA